MKLAFRIECPHCKWGLEWLDRYVNQGWLELTCSHCQKTFFNKISIPSVVVETTVDRPECMAIHRKKQLPDFDGDPTYVCGTVYCPHGHLIDSHECETCSTSPAK